MSSLDRFARDDVLLPARREHAGRLTDRARRAGYVTRFAIREEFIARYPVQQVGARLHTEHRK